MKPAKNPVSRRSFIASLLAGSVVAAVAPTELFAKPPVEVAPARAIAASWFDLCAVTSDSWLVRIENVSA